MKNQDQFEREISARFNANFDETYVIGIESSINAFSNDHYLQDLKRKGLVEYPYCICMKAADRSLYDIISQGNYKLL